MKKVPFTHKGKVVGWAIIYEEEGVSKITATITDPDFIKELEETLGWQKGSEAEEQNSQKGS